MLCTKIQKQLKEYFIFLSTGECIKGINNYMMNLLGLNIINLHSHV